MAEIKIDMNSVTPAAPGAGQLGLYPKADGNWYQLTSGGVETLLTQVTNLTVARGTDSSTGTVNNYNVSNVTHLTFTGASALTITGIANGATGRTLFIRNGGTSTVKFTDNDTNSLAANRIHWPSTQGQILGVKGEVMLVWNGTDWDGTCINPGQWIDVAYSAGNFAGNGGGGGGWVLPLGATNQVTFSYQQSGAQLQLLFFVQNTSITVATIQNMLLTLPNGFIASKSLVTSLIDLTINAVVLSGILSLTAGSAQVSIYKQDRTLMATGASNNNVSFATSFQIQ